MPDINGLMHESSPAELRFMQSLPSPPGNTKRHFKMSSEPSSPFGMVYPYKTPNHRRTESPPDLQIEVPVSSPPPSPTSPESCSRQYAQDFSYTPPTVSRIYNGNMHSLTSNKELEDLAETLRTRRQKLRSDNPQMAFSLNMIGNAHFRRAEYSSALDAYMEALSSYRHAHGNDHLAVVATLVNVGNLYWMTGDMEQSAEYMNEALGIHEYLANNKDDDIELAGTLHSVGIVFFMKQEYRAAIDKLNRALNIRMKISGHSNLDVAMTLDVLGNVYLKMDNPAVAIKNHEAALKIKKSRLGSNHPSVVTSLMNIGNAHRYMGDFEDAITTYEEALQILKALNSSDVRTVQEIGITHHMIGMVYWDETKAYDKTKAHGQTIAFDALKSFTEAKRMYKKAGLTDDDVCLSNLKKITVVIKKYIRGNRSISCF